MKETKTFFVKNNKLNKGYSKRSRHDHTMPDSVFYRKKFEQSLPNIDLMREYEDLKPGTLAEVIEMATKEQSHKHKYEFAKNTAKLKAVKFGQICSVISVFFISAASAGLVFAGYPISGLILAGIAFGSMALCSIYGPKNS